MWNLNCRGEHRPCAEHPPQRWEGPAGGPAADMWAGCMYTHAAEPKLWDPVAVVFIHFTASVPAFLGTSDFYLYLK